MARSGSSQDLRRRTVRPPCAPAPAMAEPPAAHRSSPRLCILYTWVCAWWTRAWPSQLDVRLILKRIFGHWEGFPNSKSSSWHLRGYWFWSAKISSVYLSIIQYIGALDGFRLRSCALIAVTLVQHWLIQSCTLPHLSLQCWCISCKILNVMSLPSWSGKKHGDELRKIGGSNVFRNW